MTVTDAQPLAAPAANSNSDIYDITVIGAGPTGLFAAFYAGLREMRVKIIEALPEIGGQLTTLYPEKWIFDVPGFPKILARDLVAQMLEQTLQYAPTICLNERVLKLEHVKDANGLPAAEIERVDADAITRMGAEVAKQPEDQTEKPLLKLTTNKDVHLTRSVVICGGVGAFAPNKLQTVPSADEYEGRGVYYFVREKSTFKGKKLLIVGGGDSALDWVFNLYEDAEHVTLIHRRDGFRAHESSVKLLFTLPVAVKLFYELKEVLGDGEKVTGAIVFDNRTGEELTLDVDAVLLNLGFKADLGPIKEWGLPLEKRAIKVNSRMETGLAGVYAAGDIAAEEIKLNLIAVGFSQAAVAVNMAKHYVDPSANIFPGHSSEKSPAPGQ